jgi:hypothetical protein
MSPPEPALLCANYGCLRAKETTPNPLANIPNEARTIFHVWSVSTPFTKSASDPRKLATPTTQIALEGTVLFAPGEGVEVLGLSRTTSTMNVAKNNANAIARAPFRTSKYTLRRTGALTMKAIRSLFCATSIFVIGRLSFLLRWRGTWNRRPWRCRRRRD